MLFLKYPSLVKLFIQLMKYIFFSSNQRYQTLRCPYQIQVFISLLKNLTISVEIW